jgi:hypothetical protein
MRTLKMLKILAKYLATFSLFVASCAHTAQGDLMLYYDMSDGDYFMEK